jgi:hypothetical protein
MLKEPCPMCMSAMVWAGMGGVVWGTSIEQLRHLVGSVFYLLLVGLVFPAHTAQGQDRCWCRAGVSCCGGGREHKGHDNPGEPRATTDTSAKTRPRAGFVIACAGPYCAAATSELESSRREIYRGGWRANTARKRQQSKPCSSSNSRPIRAPQSATRGSDREAADIVSSDGSRAPTEFLRCIPGTHADIAIFGQLAPSKLPLSDALEAHATI